MRRLRRAGAVLVGTHHLYEFAMCGAAANPHFGSLLNPWDKDRAPGGSSSGSAVADNLCGRLTRIKSASFFLERLNVPDVESKLGKLLRKRFAEGVSVDASDLHEIMVMRAGMRRVVEVAF